MNEPTVGKFFKAAGFGKRIEFWLIGRMLKDGFHVFVPLVDDIGIDAVVRRDEGSFVEAQIKARSDKCKLGTAGLFHVMAVRPQSNYWYVFYSERMNTMWIMTTAEFIEHSSELERGKYPGLRWIKFNGLRRNKTTGGYDEPVLNRFEKFVCKDFSRMRVERPGRLGKAYHRQLAGVSGKRECQQERECHGILASWHSRYLAQDHMITRVTS